MSRHRTTSLAAAAVAVAAIAVAAAPASARTVVSTNWAGYAVTGPHFKHVSARWTESKGACEPGDRSFSSAWVGLGGFKNGSPGLEQTGTDLDCSRSGHASHEAWYELVPAPSRPIKMKIHGGDKMAASVTVRGKNVKIILRNRTTDRTFVKRAKMKRPGVESAEWIVEAPSGCTGDGHCEVLPLGNFGSERFTQASATSVKGREGSISSSAWNRSKIILSEGDSGNGASAEPSALASGGRAFSVTYHDGGSGGFNGKRAVPTTTFPSTTLPGAPRPHVVVRP
jgi:hypothetical protein